VTIIIITITIITITIIITVYAMNAEQRQMAADLWSWSKSTD